MTDNISFKAITNKIYLIRSRKIFYDCDLASLYGVAVRVLKHAVWRGRGDIHLLLLWMGIENRRH